MRKIALAMALVALAACAQRVATSSVASVPLPKPFQAPGSWGLFVSDRYPMDRNWHLTQLDAGNLNDAQPALTGDGFTIASADGSTLAELDYAPDQSASVHIIDARTGRQRASFHSPFAAGPVLTSDGSRLLVLNSTGYLWELFDTKTGKSEGKLQDDADPCCNLLDFWLDPSGQFLYRGLVHGSGPGAKGPVTPVLVQYDLKAGHEVRRLTLAGVQAGLWQGPRIIGSERVSSMMIPGIALSPDGSRISVLYDRGSRLMTIDTATFKVVADHRLAAPRPDADRLGLMPLDAEAKYEEGIQWNMAYSPDGLRLVAWATQTSVDGVGNYSHHGLGVKLIDAQSGAVTAAGRNLDFDQALYAPDGSALYLTSMLPNSHMVLMRLDSTNLAVAARREFTEARTILPLAR